jgi:hypothetical protein
LLFGLGGGGGGGGGGGSGGGGAGGTTFVGPFAFLRLQLQPFLSQL